MNTHFAHAADAVAEMAAAIARDFPDALVEVTYHRHGQPRAQHQVSHAGALESVLQRYTERFRGARVFYTPHHPYGMVCIIECWCRCNPETGACACADLHNRSSIVLMLKERDQRPVRIGACRPPRPKPRPEDAPRPWRAEERPPR